MLIYQAKYISASLLKEEDRSNDWRVSFRVFHSYPVERGVFLGDSVMVFRIHMERGAAQPQRLKSLLAPLDCDA